MIFTVGQDRAKFVELAVKMGMGSCNLNAIKHSLANDFLFPLKRSCCLPKEKTNMSDDG